MRTPIHLLLLPMLGAVLFHLTGCGKNSPTTTPNPDPTNASIIPSPDAKSELSNGTNGAIKNLPIYTYEVVNTWPHDRFAFTQGLVFLEDGFIEGTGLNGRSTLRKVDLKTGRILKQVDLPSDYFGEGVAVLGARIFQLTWQNRKGFVYDLESFRLEREFSYEGEGWGLTTDGHWLILSDGTHQIRFLDPVTFEVKRTINVQDRGRPVPRLNELEYIKGEIFANVWGADFVVRIDPATGRVTGAIDFTGLLAAPDRSENPDVLNGIAYDAAKDRLFVTGKLWPKLFEVRLKLK